MKTTLQDSTATIVADLRGRTGFIGSTEVMSIIGISRSVLFRWVHSRKIPAYKLGKNFAFDPLQLATWLEAQHL